MISADMEYGEVVDWEWMWSLVIYTLPESFEKLCLLKQLAPIETDKSGITLLIWLENRLSQKIKGLNEQDYWDAEEI